MATGKFDYLVKTDNVGMRIRWFKWANNKTILGGVAFPSSRYGTDTTESRLFAVDADDPKKEMRVLIEPRYNRISAEHFSQFQDNVIDFLPDDPEHVLISIDLEKANMPSVYKLNIYNKKKSKVIRGKRNVRTWMTDQQGKVRIAVAQNYKNGLREVFYISDEGEWQLLYEHNALEDTGITPLGFGLDANALYYQAYKGDLLALYKMNVSTKVSEVVFEDPEYDVDGSLLYSRKTRDVIGIRHLNAPGGKIYWDKDRQHFKDSIDHALPDTNNYVVEFSDNDTQYLLYIESTTQPGLYLIGDRDQHTLFPALNRYPQLAKAVLNDHSLSRYEARDGVTIEGYLTLPKRGEAPFPTILHPHGGPGARDVSGFDYWTAYFVSKGYAVFRPNFRGSTGYGRKFAESQMQGWGLTMQDDLEDVTKWLIETGVANKDKICVAGASYGGYAAAMSAVKSPELYQCAVSFAGVFNLRKLVSQSRKYLNTKFVKKQIGSNAKDLKQRSPHYLAENVDIPLLLVHGEDDRVVDVEQSRQFFAELQDEGKDVNYVELADGNHYLSIQKNRHAFFKQMDLFLTKHLEN